MSSVENARPLTPVSKNIKHIRDKLNLSLEALAKRLGVHHGTVGRWERGETDPSELAMRSLARVVVVPYEFLYLEDFPQIWHGQTEDQMDAMDEATNPVIAKLIQDHPGIVSGDKLIKREVMSLRGTGGELNAEGIAHALPIIQRKYQTLKRLDDIFDSASGEAIALATLVDYIWNSTRVTETNH